VMERTLRVDFGATGFPYAQHLVQAFIGGSELHGAKLEGTDDHDVYGVYIEPPSKILGLDADEHFVWSTSGTERKNGPDDVDVTLYGLRKFAGLACKGNPTVLHFLFAENLAELSPWNKTWEKLLNHRSDFLAKTHYTKYLSYADAQLRRMKGERSLKVNRPKLVEEHGFDTKFAMHVIRILVECEELLSKGVITLPSPEKDFLISIRKGEVEKERVLEDAAARIERCKHLAETSHCLPETIDRERVSQLIADLYREHWKAAGI
jgi:uncharacterized protein